MEILNIPITAGELKTFAMGGQYIEVLEATGTMDITLMGPAGNVETAKGAESGSWMKESFTSFTIKSPGAQTIKMLITGREGGSRRQSGQTSILGTVDVEVQNAVTIAGTVPVNLQNPTAVNGAFTQTEPAVTNVAGGVVVFAAKASRRYLFIQNNDPAANLRVTLENSAPVEDTQPAPHGIKIEPGNYWECGGAFAPTGVIKVISDTATAKVTAVEG
jgi:hypothetical protein